MDLLSLLLLSIGIFPALQKWTKCKRILWAMEIISYSKGLSCLIDMARVRASSNKEAVLQVTIVTVLSHRSELISKADIS